MAPKKVKAMKKELSKEARLVFDEMPDSLLIRLQWFSEAMEIPVWQVIHNLLIDQWARTVARVRAEGGFYPRLLNEFAKETLEDGTEQLVTGEALFRSLVQWYEQELNQPLQDQKLDKQMAELNEYKLSPGESVTIQELQRRKARAEFLKIHPDKKDLYDRSQAHDKEQKTKRKYEK